MTVSDRVRFATRHNFWPMRRELLGWMPQVPTERDIEVHRAWMKVREEARRAFRVSGQRGGRSPVPATKEQDGTPETRGPEGETPNTSNT